MSRGGAEIRGSSRTLGGENLPRLGIAVRRGNIRRRFWRFALITFALVACVGAAIVALLS